MGKACPPYKSVVVVGLGLIGGSVAKGLRRRFPGLEVIGVDPAEATLQAALGDRAITRAYPTLPGRFEKGSLIVLATGLKGIFEALEALDGAIPEGVWLTDVTGLKRRVVALVEQLGGSLARAYVVRWVPRIPYGMLLQRRRGVCKAHGVLAGVGGRRP